MFRDADKKCFLIIGYKVFTALEIKCSGSLKKSVLGSQIMFSDARDPRVLGYEAQVSLALEFKMFRGWKQYLLDRGIEVFHALE